MADVIVVGAGPAGASLAVMLGRAGHEVVVFDKARFPRDKACGEGLMPSGVAVLQRLGLMDAVSNGAPFWGIRYHAAGRTARGRFPTLPGWPNYGLGQRRLALDERLATAVRATPGVTFHEGTRVTRLLTRDSRTVGVEALDQAFEAPLVVLADGLHSPLRKAAGLENRPMARPRLGLRAHFRLPEGREVAPWVEVFLGDRRRELYVTPLPERTVLVAALVDQGAIGGKPADAFNGWVMAEPALAQLLDGAETISPVIGLSPLDNQPSTGVAPGLVLLGDAAGFLDPITGGGMAQALLSAELLARWVPAMLAEPDGDGLARFASARQAMLRDYRLVTRFVLALADQPRLSGFTLRLLQTYPALFSHLLGVNSGCKPLWRVW